MAPRASVWGSRVSRWRIGPRRIAGFVLVPVAALAAILILAVGISHAESLSATRGELSPAIANGESYSVHADPRNTIDVYVDETSARGRVDCAAGPDQIDPNPTTSAAPLSLADTAAGASTGYSAGPQFPHAWGANVSQAGTVTLTCWTDNADGVYYVDSQNAATPETSASYVAALLVGVLIGIPGILMAALPYRARKRASIPEVILIA